MNISISKMQTEPKMSTGSGKKSIAFEELKAQHWLMQVCSPLISDPTKPLSVNTSPHLLCFMLTCLLLLLVIWCLSFLTAPSLGLSHRYFFPCISLSSTFTVYLFLLHPFLFLSVFFSFLFMPPPHFNNMA